MSFLNDSINDPIRELELLSFSDIPNISLDIIQFDSQDDYIRLIHKFVSMYICTMRRKDHEKDIKQKLEIIIKDLHSKYEQRYNKSITVQSKM